MADEAAFQTARRNRRYILHRERVKKAKAIIDDKPPIINAAVTAKFNRTKEDTETYIQRYKTNMQLLVNINRIERTIGSVDTFSRNRQFFRTGIPEKLARIEKLEMENFEFGKRLLGVKAIVKTLPDKPHYNQRKAVLRFKPPATILEKYGNKISIPDDYIRLKKLFRPIIWFHLEAKGYRPLGKIVVQLYTEAAPQVVFELVRLCFHKQLNRLQFIRLFSGLWSDVNIILDNDTLITKNIEYDKRALDHGQYSGVFSFNLNLNAISMKRGAFNFSISFKPLGVLNGKRVGFGHVIQGVKTLICMQDYSTKNGKPTKDLVITDSGLY